MDAVVKLFKAEADSATARGNKVGGKTARSAKGTRGKVKAEKGTPGKGISEKAGTATVAPAKNTPADTVAANAVLGIPAPAKRPSRSEAEAAVRTLLAYIGEDPAREGLLDTPQRVVKAYDEMFAGYGEDAGELLERTFGEIGTFDDFVLLRDIPFHSHCEHHMVPFSGKAHVAYFPVERVVGLSKIARVVDIYARRLQTQEHLTSQIITALETALRPRGVAVMIEAEHMCMSMRGITKEGVSTLTTQFTGVFREQPAEQVRFITLLRSKG